MMGKESNCVQQRGRRQRQRRRKRRVRLVGGGQEKSEIGWRRSTCVNEQGNWFLGLRRVARRALPMQCTSYHQHYPYAFLCWKTRAHGACKHSHKGCIWHSTYVAMHAFSCGASMLRQHSALVPRGVATSDVDTSLDVVACQCVLQAVLRFSAVIIICWWCSKSLRDQLLGTDRLALQSALPVNRPHMPFSLACMLSLLHAWMMSWRA